MMGKVIMSGIVPPLVAPVTGTPLGDLAVGSTLSLNVNGVAKDFLVVNQGKPSSSSLYDESCNGTWLLMKNVYENRQWASSNYNKYADSTIHSYLNGDFLNLFDADIRSYIKQVKIPYVNGTGTSGSVLSGASGLSTKIFLLSGYEVGFSTSIRNSFPEDGAKLSYFESGNTSNAKAKRIAYMNNSKVMWWTRSPVTGNDATDYVPWGVSTDGSHSLGYSANSSKGIRPALILPSDAILQDDGSIIMK